MSNMTYLRELKRKLRFKLIKLEEAKFIAYVKAFRLLRNKILDGKHADKKLQYEAEDAEADSKFAATSDQALFTQVGKALSCWAALEEMLVCIASLLLTTDIKKAGVVMYSIINFGAWLTIVSELFSHEDLYVPLKPKWDKLTSRLRGLKDVRDRLAHHGALEADTPAALFKLKSLKPSAFDVRAKSMKYQPLTVHQIAEFNEAVGDMMKVVTALVLEMEAIKNAHLKFLDSEIDRLAKEGTAEGLYKKAAKEE